jgi:mannose-6-phosphate isomerase class I
MQQKQLQQEIEILNGQKQELEIQKNNESQGYKEQLYNLNSEIEKRNIMNQELQQKNQENEIYKSNVIEKLNNLNYKIDSYINEINQIANTSDSEFIKDLLNAIEIKLGDIISDQGGNPNRGGKKMMKQKNRVSIRKKNNYSSSRKYKNKKGKIRKTLRKK